MLGTAPPILLPLVAAGQGIAPGDRLSLQAAAAGLALVVAVGGLSAQHRLPLSAALLYLLFGLGAGAGLGGLDWPWIDPLAESDVVEHVTLLALIVSVFATGLRVPYPLRSPHWRAVLVLLLVVMPLTVAAVAAFGVLALGLPLGAAIVLGGVLSPTDPVLAGTVGAPGPSEGQPEDESDPAQFQITAEAGANDGLAAPFVFLGLLVLEHDGWGALPEWILADVLWGVGVAIAAGAAFGPLLARLSLRLERSELVPGELDLFFVLGGVLLLFGVVNALDAYGLLAAFAAGVAFRRQEATDAYDERAHQGTLVAENLLELVVVFLLGTFLGLYGLDEAPPAGWLLVALLLIAIRPAAVAVAVGPLRLGAARTAFLGWFGVRGIASVYFASVALGEGLLTPEDARTVFWTAAVVVAASIVAHGVTSDALSRRWLRAE